MNRPLPGFWFADKLDTKGAVVFIHVLFISNLFDTYIYSNCGLESLAHLYHKWAGEQMIARAI